MIEPSRNMQPPAGDPVLEEEDAMDADFDLAMPPSEEDEVTEQDTRIYTPPPHIAARFYRPSHARRKDSAASSRRNSISSAHSRCSSVQQTASSSQRQGTADQSKYIAQHLRRATFLEDRRARLADRAAHAEKVRLRAAVAKAATRNTTVSEERALAAQQARERNLAEIVASCAEEVKKAKQVAETMKERREQNLAKMKAQMEERLAEAERRREELRKQGSKTRGRGQSIMARRPAEAAPLTVKGPGKPPLTPEVAAAMISGWWMGCSRRRAIHEFNNLGLSVDSIRDTLFDTVVELLAQERVLMVTARLLRICGLREADPGSVGEMAVVRTFLSAFLILGHPNQVLANKVDGQGDAEDEGNPVAHRLPASDLENPQLQDLLGKAKDLLICFETILSRLTSANRYTMPPALEKTLPEAYASFYSAFIAWKSRDSNALIEVMLLQFIELDTIFHTVKDSTDDAAAQLYRQSIQDSQLMLIVRIKKLAGAEAGKRMIFEAVCEARKARKTKKKTGDTKPRAADAAVGESSAAASSLVSPDLQMPTPPSTPAQKREGKVAARGGLGGLLPDNRTIVHELAINKEYQVTSQEYQEQMAAHSTRRYEAIRAQLASGDAELHFEYFMIITEEIREKLQRLVKAGNSMHTFIGEILDPQMAQQQFILGNFSYEKFFAAMASLLPKLCAPFRDEQVQDLVKNKFNDDSLMNRVEALNEFIDVMLCDYVNYLLRVAAPGLIESAPLYEAKRFAEEVQSGRVTLQLAEEAWRSARSKVVAECQKRDPEGVNHPKSRPTASRIYAQMLVDVFTQPRPIVRPDVPEMLQLDLRRIDEVTCTVQQIVTVGAILLQCKNLLKRDVRSPWKTEASRIMAVLEAKHASVQTTLDGTMAALEAGRSMPPTTKVHLRALVSKVLTASRDMSHNGLEPREPVLKLLLTRLRGNILSRLTPGSASDKVKAGGAAGEKLISLGLSEFVDKVHHVSNLLDKVGTVDRAAHSSWWDAVATKVEREGTNPSSSSSGPS